MVWHLAQVLLLLDLPTAAYTLLIYLTKCEGGETGGLGGGSVVGQAHLMLLLPLLPLYPCELPLLLCGLLAETAGHLELAPSSPCLAVFYNRNRVIEAVAPRPGLALLHEHGEEECLDHEAAAVTAGEKIVLRSDVVFRRRA